MTATAKTREFLYCDGFYVVELGDRRFDVCVIAGVPRFAIDYAGEDITVENWDALSNAEGRWWAAAPFEKAE